MFPVSAVNHILDSWVRCFTRRRPVRHPLWKRYRSIMVSSLAGVEALEAKGFLVLLKGDGERSSKRRTVVIAMPGTDHAFR